MSVVSAEPWQCERRDCDEQPPATCGPGCSRETCPALRQSQDDVEMLLAKRTQQDEVLWRLQARASRWRCVIKGQTPPERTVPDANRS